MSQELTEMRAILEQIKQLDVVRPMPSIIVELGNGSIIVTVAQDTRVLCRDAHGVDIHVKRADFAEFAKRRKDIETYAINCVAAHELQEI